MKRAILIICALLCAAALVLLLVAVAAVVGLAELRSLVVLLLACGCCALLYLAAKLAVFRCRLSSGCMKAAFCVCFGLYACVLVYFLFFSGDYGRTAQQELSLAEYIKNHFSLRPFFYTADIIRGCRAGVYSVRFAVRNLGGNLAAFMPCALFLPLLFPKLHSFGRFVACVAAAVCCVEAVQLFTMRGFCDIDDLIYNTLGAAVMFLLLHHRGVRTLVGSFCSPLEY